MLLRQSLTGATEAKDSQGSYLKRIWFIKWVVRKGGAILNQNFLDIQKKTPYTIFFFLFLKKKKKRTGSTVGHPQDI